MSFDYLLSLDQSLLLALNGSDSLYLDGLMLTYTSGFTWIPLYVGLLYLVIKNNETMLQILWAVLCFAICIFISDLLADGIVKPLVHRYRPCSDPSIKYIVDIANGHMRKLFDDVKETKQKWGNKIVIMIGNIANPKAYEYVAECGADYVRLGIGGGFGCITTTQTGVHYPMASLILDTIEVKKDIIKRHLDLCGSNEFQKHLEFVSKLPRIVADGGIRNFDDICKALALGADYVMIGSLFSRMYESTGTKFYETDKGLQKFPEECFENLRCENDEIWYGDYKDKEYESLFKDITNKLEKKNHKIGKLYKTYYGMASKKGQIDLKGKKEQISEGTIKTIKIEYTMEKWVKRCIHYLRTAMSYTDCETIDEFKIKPKLIVGSSNAIFAVNK